MPLPRVGTRRPVGRPWRRALRRPHHRSRRDRPWDWRAGRDAPPDRLRRRAALAAGRGLGVAGARARIFTTLPLFDHHDMEALNQAYDDLVTIAYELGLHPDTSNADTAATLRSTSPEDLTQIVPMIAVKD